MGVYEIKSYDSDGNVTDVDPILYPADILNAGANSTAYATYAQGISLTVDDGSVSDKSVSINHNDRFTIDDETQFVVAYLNEDGDDIDDDSIVGITGPSGLSGHQCCGCQQSDRQRDQRRLHPECGRL